MYENTESKFPEGTIRAAVALHGDGWRGGFGPELRDAASMLTCQQLKREGATPQQRETWRTYHAARKAGQVRF